MESELEPNQTNLSDIFAALPEWIFIFGILEIVFFSQDSRGDFLVWYDYLRCKQY